MDPITISSIIGAGASVLDKGYDIFSGERAYSKQSANNAWNQKYALISSLWNRQNQEKDMATLFAREDNAWQRAVADIQKAGLSTTMLSGGAGSGMVSGHGASSAPSLGSGKFTSGATVGSVLDMYGQYLDFKQKQEQTELIKDQQKYYQALKNKTVNDQNNDSIRTLDNSAKIKAEVASMNANTQGRLITNQSDALRLDEASMNYAEGLTTDGRLGNEYSDNDFYKIPVIGWFAKSVKNYYYKKQRMAQRNERGRGYKDVY